MNKQELIEGIANLDRVYGEKYYVDLEDVLDLVKQLDEPEKVVIPQFVADWIEKSKSNGWDLLASMCFTLTAKNKQVTKWLHLGENVNIFALAWIFGYEVEKEKRYTIRFKNIRKETRYLKYDRVVENWYFGVEQCSKETKISHTRKELEGAGFGWVFDCEGIEVKEVTE